MSRAARWLASRRVVLAVAGSPVVAGLALAAWVGSFSSPAAWEAATGWQTIPPDDRPREDPAPPFTGEAPRIHWLGHSGFLIEWHGRRIAIDPNTSPQCTIAPRRMQPPLDAADLGPIDAALISHAHYDHLDLPTLRRLPRLGAIVLPAGSESYFDPRDHSDARFVPLHEGERWRLEPLEVVAVRAQHHGSRFHPLASSRFALGYVIRFGDDALYYSGDTGWGDQFHAVREHFHPRIAILPIGAYAPALPMRYFHLSPEDAVEVARVLGVSQVIPCHFGTFVLSLDRPSAALPRFARAARLREVPWTMPRLLLDRSALVARLDGKEPR